MPPSFDGGFLFGALCTAEMLAVDVHPEPAAALPRRGLWWPFGVWNQPLTPFGAPMHGALNMGIQAPAANLAGDSYGHPVVSRKAGERIIVGGGLLVIEVAQVRGNRVRLRVSAPRELRIDREEVHDARVRMGGMVDEVLRAADETTNRKVNR